MLKQFMGAICVVRDYFYSIGKVCAQSACRGAVTLPKIRLTWPLVWLGSASGCAATTRYIRTQDFNNLMNVSSHAAGDIDDVRGAVIQFRHARLFRPERLVEAPDLTQDRRCRCLGG